MSIKVKSPDSPNRTTGALKRSSNHQAGLQSTTDSGCRTCHLPTFLSTLATSLRTLLAVIRFVLLAFGGTGIAKLSTQLAGLLGELRSTAHQCGCRPADSGTVPIRSDAVRHVSDVGFAQAGVCTVFTGLSAINASVDTSPKFLLSHFHSPLVEDGVVARSNQNISKYRAGLQATDDLLEDKGSDTWQLIPSAA